MIRADGTEHSTACAHCLLAVVQIVSVACAPTPETTYAERFIEGGPIRASLGLAFDASDRLFVASIGEIVVVDRDSGEILDRIGQERGVQGAVDDLDFGVDGSLYWTEFFGGDVGRLAPEGGVTKQHVGPGANPITVADTGRVFVGRDMWGEGLYELGPELDVAPRLIASFPMNAMDWGPDGFLYGPSPRERGIYLVRVDVDSGNTTVLATRPAAGGRGALKFDNQGRLHFMTHIGQASQIERLDLEGDGEIVASGLERLDNLAFDSTGRLFGSLGSRGGIVEIREDGETRTVVRGGLTLPGGVAVLPGSESESLFVADFSRVREFSIASGAQVASHAVEGHTVSRDGNRLISTSWVRGEVVRWNPSEAAAPQRYGDFVLPLNAIGFGAAIVVTELGSSSDRVRVVMIENGTRSTLLDVDDGLGVPSGMAATLEDLWVADLEHGRIMQVIAGGRALEAPRIVASDLQQPTGLAINSDGHLLVLESQAGRLSAIDSETGARVTVADHLQLGNTSVAGLSPAESIDKMRRCAANPGPRCAGRAFWGLPLNGVAVTEQGIIYVASYEANVVYRIAP